MLLLFRNRGGGGDFPPGFNPSTDYWWDGSDPTTMWQDTAKTTAVGPGDPVRVWRSKGVAVDAVAPSDPARATWNGTNELTFSGAQTYTLPSRTITAPETRLFVARRASIVPADCLCSPTALGAVFFNNGSNQIRARTASVQFAVTLGTTTIKLAALVVFDGATSIIRQNSAEATGDTGTLNSTGQLIIGGGFADPLTGILSSVYIKTNYAADATERAALEAWFAAKYGVVLP